MSSQPTAQERSVADWFGDFTRAANNAIDTYREWRMLDPGYAARVQQLEMGAPGFTGSGAMSQSADAPATAAGVPVPYLLVGGAALLVAGVLIARAI